MRSSGVSNYANNGSVIFSDKKAVKGVPLPYVPKQVALTDLHENGRLLSNAEIKHLQDYPDLQASGFYDKDALNIAYDILSYEGRLWAIYKDDEEHALGSGSFGQVILAQDLQNGRFYALKKQQIEKDNEYRLNGIKAEFEILKDLGEVPYQGDLPVSEFSIEVPVDDEEEGAEKEAEEKTITVDYVELSILMELVKGVSIENLIAKEDAQLNAVLCDAEAQGREVSKDMLPRPLVSPLMRIQMAIAAIQAELALQEAGYLHRDASPGNIIFNPATQTAKMIDFGHSRKLTDGVCRSGIQGPTGGLPLEIREELIKLLNARDMGEYYNPDNLVFNDATESFTLATTLAVLFGLFEQFEENDVRRWEKRAPIITDTENSLFDFNTCGFDESQLKRLLNMLHAMTSEITESKKRLLMLNALPILQSLQLELIAAGAKVQTGVLDLAECLDEEGNILPGYIEGLKQMQTEEVWLIRSDKKTMSDLGYIKAIRQLEAMGLRVGDKVYIAADAKQAKEKVEQHLRKRPLPSECTLVAEDCHPMQQKESPPFMHVGSLNI